MNEEQIRPVIVLSELQRRTEAAAARLATHVLALNELGDEAEGMLASQGDLGGGNVVVSSDKYDQWNRLRERLETAIAKTLVNRYEVEVDDASTQTPAGEMILNMPDVSLLNPHELPLIKWQWSSYGESVVREEEG